MARQKTPEPQRGESTSAANSGKVTEQMDSELPELSKNDVVILAETFRLLGDASRLRIMLCCLEGPTSVGDIAERLALSQSLVSHHLRLLRGARLVKGVRHAKHIFYEVADSHVSQVLRDMAHHIAEEHNGD